MTNEYHLVRDLEEVESMGTREGFGEAMVELGKRSSEVVVVTGDLSESMRVLDFAKKFPERFVDVGVAEQNLMGVAVGLALSGKVPFAVSYASFNPGRNWDQLRVGACYSNANVKVVGGHAGLTVGTDGATHQALEDIAITRVLPNIKVVVPADFEQAKKATFALASDYGPSYIRLTRPKSAMFTTKATPFEIGKAQILREGSDLSVFACGPVVYEALVAASELSHELNIEVINVHTIKPLDFETILGSARKTKRVLTVEDHQVMGGLGGAISELLSCNLPTKMTMMGVHDTFGESGDVKALLEKYELDKNAIIKKIKEIIS